MAAEVWVTCSICFEDAKVRGGGDVHEVKQKLRADGYLCIGDCFKSLVVVCGDCSLALMMGD